MDEQSNSSYTVRRLTPSDAASMPALTTRVNGPSYIHAEMYQPDETVRMIHFGMNVGRAVYSRSEGRHRCRIRRSQPADRVAGIALLVHFAWASILAETCVDRVRGTGRQEWDPLSEVASRRCFSRNAEGILPPSWLKNS